MLACLDVGCKAYGSSLQSVHAMYTAVGGFPLQKLAVQGKSASGPLLRGHEHLRGLGGSLVLANRRVVTGVEANEGDATRQCRQERVEQKDEAHAEARHVQLIGQRPCEGY